MRNIERGSRLALLPGEPAGIGPELCVRLAQRNRDVQLVAIADPNTLLAAAKALQLPLQLHSKDEPVFAAGHLNIDAVAQTANTQFGVGNAQNSAQVLACLKRAADGCLSGEFAGMVTGPINKALINDAGIDYVGTTEQLAVHASADVVMMLANPIVRVALVTTHLPLRNVADAITQDSVARALRITHKALREQFGIANPCIAVLGLNPHAGEQGVLGREEIDQIIPAVKQCAAAGMNLIGPLPADTAFLPEKLRGFDAVLAMYHDQGLPVLKYSGFEQAVNITLGLPYPRVAVDHGTAFEIAGKGIAKADSLNAAYDLCVQLAQKSTPSRA
jgi:4-hydroxythreonine-4-phosphate dehydrogenase